MSMPSPVGPPPKRLLVMASSNDQQIQPHLLAMPTTLNHIPIAVNKEQEEQDQTFGNYIPNHFNGERSWRQTQSFAPGYRFCPLDGELIVFYLRKKVNNEALPHNGIRDVTLYQHNPEYLTARHPALGDKKWYFFTLRDRKYPNGFRPNRRTGNGYWKATGADKPVDYKDQVVGLRMALVFYEGKPKPGKGIKTNWIMHEFRVKGPPRIKENQHDMKLDDWVLCRIYKKEKGKKGEGREEEKGGAQAEHKPVSVSVPVPVSIPSLAATLLEGSVNDNNLMGESLKYDEYIQSPQHPKIGQSIDEFHPYRDIFAASDPQPTLVSVAWPAATARAPPVHLDNKYYFQEELDDFDTDGLFAQNLNSAGQNSYNVPV